jgi:hypothetical protein
MSATMTAAAMAEMALRMPGVILSSSFGGHILLLEDARREALPSKRLIGARPNSAQDRI